MVASQTGQCVYIYRDCSIRFLVGRWLHPPDDGGGSGVVATRLITDTPVGVIHTRQ